MISKIIGNYVFENSFIHKLDPRTKILSLITLMFVVFVDSGFFGYFLIFMLILFLFYIAKISLLSLYNSIKFLRFMLIFLLLLNSFILRKGTLVFTIPFLNWPFYDQVFIKTFYIFFRITLMISFSLLLSSTTKPLNLALGIEHLLKPLKLFKINVEVFAMMVSIALRFIPTLILEAQNILNAQASRGLDFKNGGIKTKFKAVYALTIPLLISSFNKADELALSMESKNYNPNTSRTRYRKIIFAKKDLLAFLILLIFSTFFIFYAPFLKTVWG